MTTKKLYPQIDGEYNVPDGPQLNPTAPLSESDSHIFRLTHIKEIQSKLEKELEVYSRCKRIYTGVIANLTNSYIATGILSGVEAVASVTCFSTGVGAPIGLVLAGVSVGTAVISSTFKILIKRFGKNQPKHVSLSLLAC